MFEKFHFTQKQTDQYLAAALRDQKIATDSTTPEVIFHFCYNCLIKLGIAVCAENGLRVKARQGHHLELIKKLAEYLGNNDIQTIMDKNAAKTELGHVRRWSGNHQYGSKRISGAD